MSCARMLETLFRRVDWISVAVKGDGGILVAVKTGSCHDAIPSVYVCLVTLLLFF